MSRSRALIVRWATFVVWIMGSLGFGSGVSRYLQTASGPGGQRAEKRGEPFRNRRVDQDRIAQRRVGQSRGHRGLDDRHDLAGLGRERGEAQDAVAVGGDQSLVEAA